MKMTLVLVLLTLLTACSYSKDGKLVKDEHGRIYKLEQAPSNESYFLREIDTVAIKNIY